MVELDYQDRVAIVVDSAASLPAHILGSPILHVVPMQLSLDGKTYLDGVDLSPDSFYRILRDRKSLPKTSAPSPSSFLKAFQEASLTASSILCLTVSSKLSGTNDSAKIAVEEARRILPKVKISVLDTNTAAGSEGLIALKAWNAAKDGESLEDVCSVAKEILPRVYLLAYLDSVYYAWKGGRIPKIAYLSASLLGIRPIFEFSNGDITTLGRPRTAQRAIDKMLELIQCRVGSNTIHVSVMHADELDKAKMIESSIKAKFHCKELYISEFSPVMGAHTGPGLVGISFWNDMEET